MAILIPRKKEYWQRKPSYEGEIDWANSLSDKLVGYWLLNNSTYNLANMEEASEVNAPGWINNENGAGLRFTDGVNDYLDAGDKSDYGCTNAVTIISQARFSVLGDSRTVLAKGVGGSSTHAYDLKYHTGALALRASLRTSSAQTNIDGATTPTIGQTYTVGMGWDDVDDNAFIYLDGAQDGSGTFAGPIQTNTAPVIIGSVPGWSGAGEMAGDIWYSALWNRRLDADEHKSINEAPYQILKPRRKFWVVPAAGGITGNAAHSLGGVALAAAGTASIQGDYAGALVGAALSASGTSDIGGIFNPTLSGVALNAAGSVDVAGQFALSLDGLSMSGAGVVDVGGTSNPALPGVALAAAGAVLVSGAFATTLDGVVLTGRGGSGTVGERSVTLSGVTLSAAAQSDIAGALAASLAGVGLAGAGAVVVQGVYTATLVGVTLNADGSTSGGPALGDFATGLGGVALNAAGSLEVSGGLTLSLDGAALAAAGVSDIAGALSSVLSGVTLSATSGEQTLLGGQPLTLTLKFTRLDLSLKHSKLNLH